MNKQTVKGATKSKTMWFSIGLIVLGVLEQNMGLLRGLVAPEHFGYVTAGIGIASAVLRVYTTTALSNK